MQQEPHRNKHYPKVVLMKNYNTKTKMVRNKLGREDGRSYGLIQPFSLSARTNIGKVFFKMLKKTLP